MKDHNQFKALLSETKIGRLEFTKSSQRNVLEEVRTGNRKKKKNRFGKTAAVILTPVVLLAFMFLLLIQTPLSVHLPAGFSRAGQFHSSLIDETFPVPSAAKEISYKKNVLKYELPGIREEQGIPKDYLKELNAKGWKESKKDRMGAQSIFRKGKQEMRLIYLTDEFYLIKETK
ncbi:hypothetical protein [Metabacillus sp. RGM 3146]|uniref:hypothetical protein n=1 Tax=Metabacillus sp. RGM 3146 TaxID=3401092 RepID=UPI003B9DB2BB